MSATLRTYRVIVEEVSRFKVYVEAFRSGDAEDRAVDAVLNFSAEERLAHAEEDYGRLSVLDCIEVGL